MYIFQWYDSSGFVSSDRIEQIFTGRLKMLSIIQSVTGFDVSKLTEIPFQSLP